MKYQCMTYPRCYILLLIVLFLFSTCALAANPPIASDEVSKSAEASLLQAEVTSKDGFSLGFTVHQLQRNKVKLELTTNMSGAIEVMVSISLAGQDPDDVWIGEDARVRITKGKGVAILDVSELPKGRYDAEVNYYPNWGPQDNLAKSFSSKEVLEASIAFDLFGSGESAESVKFREEGQKWVMENVEMGKPWNIDFWIKKFGQMKELEVDRGNSNILKAFYFKSIDMTLIVNVRQGTIDTWRFGEAHH